MLLNFVYQDHTLCHAISFVLFLDYFIVPCFYVFVTTLRHVYRGVPEEGPLSPRPPSPLKYKLIYISSQRNIRNRTPEDAMTFFLFFFFFVWSSLDFMG